MACIPVRTHIWQELSRPLPSPAPLPLPLALVQSLGVFMGFARVGLEKEIDKMLQCSSSNCIA